MTPRAPHLSRLASDSGLTLTLVLPSLSARPAPPSLSLSKGSPLFVRPLGVLCGQNDGDSVLFADLPRSISEGQSSCTLCALCYVTSMARGRSGRIVLEVDPLLKGEMYSLLARQDLTLKEWFIRNARLYLEESRQPSLFSLREDSSHSSKPTPGTERHASGKGRSRH